MKKFAFLCTLAGAAQAWTEVQEPPNSWDVEINGAAPSTGPQASVTNSLGATTTTEPMEFMQPADFGNNMGLAWWAWRDFPMFIDYKSETGTFSYGFDANADGDFDDEHETYSWELDGMEGKTFTYLQAGVSVGGTTGTSYTMSNILIDSVSYDDLSDSMLLLKHDDDFAFDFSATATIRVDPPQPLTHPAEYKSGFADQDSNPVNFYVKLAGPKDPPTDIQVCEHQTATLTCDAGEDIKILKASYGRRDMVTCQHSQMKTSDCYNAVGDQWTGNDFTIVQGDCDGKETCSVLAKNSVFTDPCRGTFKYLTIQYKCQPAPDLLEIVDNMMVLEPNLA